MKNSRVKKSLFIFFAFVLLLSSVFSSAYADGNLDYHKGDIDRDGSLSGTDYLAIKNYFLSDSDLSGFQKIMADVNNDEKINSTDYLLIKSHFLGKTIISKDGFLNGKDISVYNECTMNEPLYSKIKADHLKTLSWDYETVSDVGISEFVGPFESGAYVMKIGTKSTCYTEAEVEINVGGVEFLFNNGHLPTVWKDGSFYSLEEAFETGLLTAEEVAIFKAIYLSQAYSGYKACFWDCPLE